MGSKALLLITGSPSNEPQKVAQRKLISIFEAKKMAFDQVDGVNPAEKEKRDNLFQISGLRGKYPQVFIQHDAGAITFVGDWEKLESLIECDGLPKEMLESNPNIDTFTKVFAFCAKA